jgi:hypothetical protein
VKPVGARNIYTDYTAAAVDVTAQEDFLVNVSAEGLRQMSADAGAEGDLAGFLRRHALTSSAAASSSGALVTEKKPQPDTAAAVANPATAAASATGRSTQQQGEMEKTVFTRVAITDDDDDSDADREEEAAVTPDFVRVAIVEEDEEEEYVKVNNHTPAAVVSGVSAVSESFTRISIQDNDDDDEGGVASDPSSAVVSAGAGGLTALELKDEGNTCMAREDYVGAVDCYSRSLAKDATLTAARNNRSLAFIALKVSDGVSTIQLLL